MVIALTRRGKLLLPGAYRAAAVVALGPPIVCVCVYSMYVDGIVYRPIDHRDVPSAVSY